MFPPRTQPKRPILRALQTNNGIGMTPIRAMRGTPNVAATVNRCPEGTVGVGGKCVPAIKNPQQYHYGRWGGNPNVVYDSYGRPIGFSGGGTPTSPDAPIRCWGPAWDRSCKVCAPLPNGGQTCSSFKVNDTHPIPNAQAPTKTMPLLQPLRNPADCSDASTPASQCTWLCYPMPTPNDPGDMHCVRVPKEARRQGAFFTSTPGVRPRRRSLFQRIADRIRG